MESIILKSKGAEERREKTRGGGAMLVKSKEERKNGRWKIDIMGGLDRMFDLDH